MKMPFRDPAENDSFLRHFYQAWRPTRLARIWNAAYAWAAGFGLTSASLLNLQPRIPGNGCLVSTVLVPVEHEGRRYQVSMLGETSQWVQNLRSAGGQALVRCGRTQPVTLVEIPAAERADPQGMVSDCDERLETHAARL